MYKKVSRSMASNKLRSFVYVPRSRVTKRNNFVFFLFSAKTQKLILIESLVKNEVIKLLYLKLKSSSLTHAKTHYFSS